MKDDDQSNVTLAQAVGAMRENILAHIELAQLQARISRAKYLALVKEGFTAAEALHLCK